MLCLECDKQITNPENTSPLCDECLDSAPVLELGEDKTVLGLSNGLKLIFPKPEE